MWTSRYDLYQIEAGFPMWCTQVMGLTYAGFKLREVSANNPDECYAVHQSTNEVVARLNVPGAGGRAPRVFYVAYDLTLADKLAHELPWYGYRFSYAAGNDLAFIILANPMKCDVFILGFAASIETRRDAAAWLTANYPDVPIIALKSPSEPAMSVAICNLNLDGERPLLPVIAQALERRALIDRDAFRDETSHKVQKIAPLGMPGGAARGDKRGSRVDRARPKNSGKLRKKAKSPRQKSLVKPRIGDRPAAD